MRLVPKDTIIYPKIIFAFIPHTCHRCGQKIWWEYMEKDNWTDQEGTKVSFFICNKCQYKNK